MFSLNHILGGENHRTWMIVYGRLTLSFTPRKENLAALDIVSSIRGLQVEFSLKITLVHLSHKHYTPNEKKGAPRNVRDGPLMRGTVNSSPI